jgi:cyclic beta-1,2-glucan synthetase
MYRAGVEYILGFQVAGNEVSLCPCVPPDWTKFSISYRYGKSTFHFEVTLSPDSAPEKKIEAQKFSLIDDGEIHRILVVF